MIEKSAGIADSRFLTDRARFSLGERSARGAAFTLTGRMLRFVIQTAGIAVLSRILLPGDFGLVGMVTIFTGLMNMFADLGLSAAVIQAPEINHRQVSNLFWLNAGMGLALAVATMAMGPAVARFYHEPRLVAVTAAAGVGFLLSGLGIQHQSLLRRRMQFGQLAVIDAASGAIAVLSGITCAWLHFGYWSLVAMPVVGAGLSAAGAWICCRWIPGLPARNSRIAGMVAFGSNLTVFNFLNYLVRNADNTLIGWRWGSIELGFYACAYQLMLLPISQIVGPIGAVAIPALSRLQHDTDGFRDYYLKVLRAVTYFSMPLLAAMAVFAEEIVQIILGPQWKPAILLFRILALAAVFQPVVSSSGWILTSLNRSRAMAWWGAVVCPVMFIAFLAGLPWGAVGVACGYTAGDWLLSIPAMAVALHASPLTLSDIGRTIYKPIVLTACLTLATLAYKFAFSSLGPFWLLLLAPIPALATILALRSGWSALRTDLAAVAANFRMIFRPAAPAAVEASSSCAS